MARCSSCRNPSRRTHFNIIARVRERNIPLRVSNTCARIRCSTKARTWHRYMCEFVGIAADDWDAIVRYVNDEPENSDRRKMQNQEPSEKVDDAYRLLPMALQEKIMAMLVAQNKLEAAETRPNAAAQTVLRWPREPCRDKSRRIVSTSTAASSAAMKCSPSTLDF